MTHNAQEVVALTILDGWLGYRSRHGNAPGFQICLRKKGKIIFSKSYGVANLQTSKKLSKHHAMRIASQSKTFTACIVLQLVEEGRLTLQQAVGDFLPVLRNHKDPRAKNITVEDLLTHRAGLLRDGVDASYWNLQKAFPSKRTLLQIVRDAELVYAPDMANSKYTNIGYALLGLLIEHIEKTSFAESLNRRIIQPFKLNIRPDWDETKYLMAAGHTRMMFDRQRKLYHHVPARSFAPAAGLCATAEEVSLFYDALLRSGSLLKARTHKKLLSTHWSMMNQKSGKYGMGVRFDDFGKSQIVGHGGAYPGFCSYTGHAIGTDYTVSFAVNANEKIAFNAAISAIEIIQRIQSNFTAAECRTLVVSPPLMDKWGATVYAVSKKRAVPFNMDSWMPARGGVFSSKEDYYVSDTLDGTAAVGEPLRFLRGGDGNITQSILGGIGAYEEKRFKRIFAKALQ